MNQLPLSVQIRNRSRSMGLKLLLVCVLALLMTIPALFVNSIVEDRTKRAEEVMQEISGRAGGQQTFLGPSLSIPYSVPPLYKGALPTHGLYVVFPTKAEAAAGLGDDVAAQNYLQQAKALSPAAFMVEATTEQMAALKGLLEKFERAAT